MIQIKDLTFRYQKKSCPVINNFNISIPDGGIVGLLGKNGAGKTTLLYLIAGLLTPENGYVLFNSVNTRIRKPEVLQEVFIVPEEFYLPSISLSEFVKFKAKFYPRFSYEDFRKNLETFELDPNLKLGSISMGQKKKAYLSFALACNTSLLLLDEPTNGLDIPGKSQFRKFIVSSMNENRSIVISSHQIFDINKIIDHVVITDKGKVIFNHFTSEILSRLRFIETNSPQLISESLFSKPSAAAQNIILRNDHEEETEINLETLFEFAVADPEKLNDIFK